MQARKTKAVLASAASAALLMATQAGVHATTPYFLPGGMVMMLVGNVNPAGGDAAFLDEIDPTTGNAIASVSPIQLPVAGGNAISESNLGTDHERQVNLSANGQYLAFIGYNTAPGSMDPSTDPAVSVPRVIGLVDAYGNLNLSTKLTDAYDETSIRGAYTTDGTNIWTAGDNGSGAVVDGGLHYTTVGSTTSVNLSTVQTTNGSKTPDNVRSVRAFDGQLFESSGSNASIGKGFFQTGTGLPTTGMPTLDKLNFGNDSTTGFYFLDTNHDGILDTVYTGSSTNESVDKFCLIGGQWVFEGSAYALDGHDGDQITAIENADGSTTVYLGTTQHLYRITDPTPYGGSMAATTLTTIVTATSLLGPTGNPVTLGGVDFAPVVADNNQWNQSSASGWQTTNNWATGVAPDTQGATATFGPKLTVSGTIGLNGTQIAGHVVFNNSSASYAIGTSSSDTLDIDDSTLNSSGIPSIVVDAGSHTINATLSLQNSVRVTTSAGTSLTISGPITNAGGFYSDGLGSLTLSGVDSYNGSTEFASGLVTLNNTGVLPVGTNLTVGDGDLAAAATFNVSAGSSGSARNMSLQSITIQQNGRMNLQSPANHASRTLLVTGGLTFSWSTNAWTGQLDLGTNDMDVESGNLGNVTNQVAEGYNGGLWNGTGGIISSAAAADTTHLTALGVILNGTTYSNMAGSLGKFDGVYPGAADVLVKYAYYGDANLSGRVDGSDYSAIDSSYASEINGPAVTGWGNGDFNYDNVVNGSDYTLIDNSFNTQIGSETTEIAGPEAITTDQIASPSAVPEPASLAILALGASAMLGRRRRVVCVSVALQAAGFAIGPR